MLMYDSLGKRWKLEALGRWSSESERDTRTPQGRRRSARRKATRPAVELLEDRTMLSNAYPYQMWNLPSNYGPVTQMAAGNDGAVWLATDTFVSWSTFTPVVNGPAELVRITPDGATTNFPLGKTIVVTALTAGTDNKMWFIEEDTSTVDGQYSLWYATASGLDQVALPGIVYLKSLAVTPDGNLWFIANTTNPSTIGATLDCYNPATKNLISYPSPLGDMGAVFTAPNDQGLYMIGTGQPNALGFDIYAGLVNTTTGQLIASNIMYPMDPTWVGTGPPSPFTSTTSTVWCDEDGFPGYYIDDFDTNPYGALSLLQVNYATAKQNVAPNVTPPTTFLPLNQDMTGGSDGYLYLEGFDCIAALNPMDATYPPTATGLVANVDAAFMLNQGQQTAGIATGSDGNIWFAATGSFTQDPITTTVPDSFGCIQVENADVGVGSNVTAPVNPGDTIHFTLDGTAGPTTPDEYTITDPIPTGTTLVPNSVVTNGTIVDDGSDGTIEIQTQGDTKPHLEFSVTVNSLDNLPLGAETLVNQAEIDADYPDGRSVASDTDYPVTLAQVNQINVTIVPQTKVPNMVSPGETYTYTLTATAAPGAQSVDVAMSAPPGTTLYNLGMPVNSIDFQSSGSQVQGTVTAVVDSQAQLPTGLDSIVATAKGTVLLSSGIPVSKTVTKTLDLGPMSVTLIPLNTSGPVAPGQTIQYEATVDVDETASKLIVTVNPPLGTTGYGGPALTQEVDNTTSNTFDFSLVVNNAANLGTLSINCTASAQATFPDGTTASGQAAYPLKVVDPLTVQVTPSMTSAKPGATFNYTITATSTVPATAFTVQDQVPAGLTVVPSSVTSGGVVTPGTGGTTLVSWTLSGGSSVNLSFSVQVQDIAHLPSGLSSVIDLATVTATIYGQIDAHEARCTTKILLPDVITGLVYDVTFDYPAQNILLPERLADVPVQLLYNGSVVQTTTTDPAGTYTFQLPNNAQGTYSVATSTPVHLYSSQSNAVDLVNYLTKPQTVTVTTAQNATYTVPDFFEPVTILAAAAFAMEDLHNLELPIWGGAFGLEPTIFSFDTSVTEKVVLNLVSNASNNPFTANDLAPPPGQTDIWWALARTIAVMDDAKTRFDAVLPLADDVGKTMALWAAANACKMAAPKSVNWANFANFDPAKVAAMEQKFRQVDRALFFTTSFAVLPTLTNMLNLSPQTKATFFEVYALAARWGSNLALNVGKLSDDTVFEAVFDLVRYGITTAIMSVMYGASLPILGATASQNGSIKLALDQAQNDLANCSYATSVNITSALSKLDSTTNSATTDASGEHKLISTFTYYLSIGRGLDGAYGINQGIFTARGGGVLTSSILGAVRGAYQKFFDTILDGVAKDKRLLAVINAAYAGTEIYTFDALVSQADDAALMADHAFNADPDNPALPG